MPAVLRSAGFAALWHPEIAVAAALFGVAYVQVVGAMRSRFAGAEPVGPERTAAFLLGLAVLYAAQGSPLELLSNRYLFSAHMLQLLLLVFVAAPLFVVGTPAWLWRALLAHLRPLHAAARFVTMRPVWALVPFVALFYAYLLPSLTDSALGNGWLYLLEHAVMMLAALLMWWPVLAPLPELPPLRPTHQVFYLGAGMQAMLPACVLLAFSGRAVYPAYMHAARLWAFLTPPVDQQLGAVVMFLASLAVFGTAVLGAFLGLAQADGAPPRALQGGVRADLRSGADAG